MKLNKLLVYRLNFTSDIRVAKVHHSNEQCKRFPNGFPAEIYEIIGESWPDFSKQSLNVAESIIKCPASFSIKLLWGVKIALPAHVSYICQLLVTVVLIFGEYPYLWFVRIACLGSCEVAEIELWHPVLMLGTIFGRRLRSHVEIASDSISKGYNINAQPGAYS
jgi:hypothetical protein